MKYPDRNAVPAPVEDPTPHLCANIEFGERCANLGTIARITLNRGPDGKGQNGPWYCAKHVFPRETESRPSAPISASAWSFDAVQLEPHEKRNDGRNWARLVLKRKAQGGQVPSIAVDFAREALGLEPEPMRQPGADD